MSSGSWCTAVLPVTLPVILQDLLWHSPANGPGGFLSSKTVLWFPKVPHLKQQYNHPWHASLKGKRQPCGRERLSLAWQCEMHANEASDIFQRILGLTRPNPHHLDSQDQFSTWSSSLDFWFKRMGLCHTYLIFPGFALVFEGVSEKHIYFFFKWL